MALEKGYATSFFSGGAPLLRKLNIQQGIEIFDDNWNPTANRFFRPFSRTQKILESWLNEIGHQSFLSVFYVPDLAFRNTPTQTSLGENRNLSFESQVEEFDSSLAQFIETLKNRKLWDSTMVILVGLNAAESGDRTTELSNTSLFSERTQVGLLIKPPHKKRSEVLSWGFDENVSLADIGYTLAKIFSGEIPQSSDLPMMDLSPVLQSANAQIGLERPLVIETTWPSDESRYGIRWGTYLFLLDEAPVVFNSLIDKTETAPIRANSLNFGTLWPKIENLRQTHQFSPWHGLSREEFLKWQGLSDIWSLELPAGPGLTFERLAHRLKSDPEMIAQYSRDLLSRQAWDELLRWSQGQKLSDLELIANRNLKHDSKRKFQDPCLKASDTNPIQNSDLKQCSDPAAISLLEWVALERNAAQDLNQRDNARKRFLRLYMLLRMDQKITEVNYGLQGPWDINRRFRQDLPVVEMMLALPDLQKFRQTAIKALQQQKED